MNLDQIILPLIGGGLIGLAVTMMLFFNGRVTGISGILSGALAKPTRDGGWRWFFLIGLILGGFILYFIRPDFFANQSDRSFALVTLAGLFVGYGTVMGSGCTSGHGVCGISRLSLRSILATVTFMLFGFFSVQAVLYLNGGSL